RRQAEGGPVRRRGACGPPAGAVPGQRRSLRRRNCPSQGRQVVHQRRLTRIVGQVFNLPLESWSRFVIGLCLWGKFATCLLNEREDGKLQTCPTRAEGNSDERQQNEGSPAPPPPLPRPQQGPRHGGTAAPDGLPQLQAHLRPVDRR